MAWKVKKEYEDTVLSKLNNYRLGDLNEKQISCLNDNILNTYFEEIKPKKKKKVNDSDN